MKIRSHKILFFVLLNAVSCFVWGINTQDFFTNSYAVVIGVKEYKDGWDDLRFAENDANEIGKYFSEQGYTVKLFLSEQATRQNIVSYLEDELPGIITEEDRVVVYFSGHGDRHKKSNKGYVIPHDGIIGKPSTWISMKKLQELSSINGVAKHQLFIVDACFAGSFAKKSTKKGKKYLRSHVENNARQFLAAGLAGEETPAESDLPGYENYSYYTSYLIKGLREGKADNYYDGVITLAELSSYLQSAARTEENTPTSGSFVGHESGSFVFSSPVEAEHFTLKKIPADTPRKRDGYLEEYDRNIMFSFGVEGVRQYLKKYPNGKYVAEAYERLKFLEDNKVRNSEAPENQSPIPKSRVNLTKAEAIEAKQVWAQDAQFSTDPKIIEDYLNKYPNGPMTSRAERKLKNLRK